MEPIETTDRNNERWRRRTTMLRWSLTFRVRLDRRKRNHSSPVPQQASETSQILDRELSLSLRNFWLLSSRFRVSSRVATQIVSNARVSLQTSEAHSFCRISSEACTMRKREPHNDRCTVQHLAMMGCYAAALQSFIAGSSCCWVRKYSAATSTTRSTTGSSPSAARKWSFGQTKRTASLLLVTDQTDFPLLWRCSCCTWDKLGGLKKNAISTTHNARQSVRGGFSAAIGQRVSFNNATESARKHLFIVTVCCRVASTRCHRAGTERAVESCTSSCSSSTPRSS